MPGHEHSSNVTAKKIRVKHLADMPLAVFINTEGKVEYLTSAKVTEIIRRAVKNIYPDISNKELMKYLLVM